MSATVTEPSGWVLTGQPVRGRGCGSCQSCCTLVPVALPFGTKPANTRCTHQCSKGCAIYAHRPTPCQAWSCRWLFDPDTAGLRRPDKTGYVIDPMLDTILKDGRPCDIVQVWVDPTRPEAHRDPALRAYLAGVAERHRLPAIVRWGSRDALFLIAPSLHAGEGWLELGGEVSSQDEMDRKLAKVGARRFLKPAPA